MPLEKVLEDGTSWKGRHEKMIALQEKLRALQLAQGTAQLTKPVSHANVAGSITCWGQEPVL